MIIQRRAFDGDNMNSLNHSKGPEVRDFDYNTEISKTDLKNWKDMIEYPVAFEWTFTRTESRHLVESMDVSLISHELSSTHQEELEEIIERLSIKLPAAPVGWFFRFNQASPKDGKRNWPIKTAKEVIEQVVTSVRARRCLKEEDHTMYFCHYQPEWDPDRELGVFVYKGRVTAISQYTKTRSSPILISK